MEYWRVMGFYYGTPLVDGENVWGFADYGLCQLWVKTVLTVTDAGEAQPVKRLGVTGLKRKSEIPEYGEVLEARREQAGAEYRESQEDDVFT
jgi:hypothetical protein